jgi:hypothetical protein
VAIIATEPLSPATLIPPASGPLLRLRVRLARAGLDARLASGEAASGDSALALRSAQLGSRRERRKLADSLERGLRAKPQRRAAFSAAIPTDARAVALARPALEQLAAALRSRDTVQARGVALGRRLLTEPASPLFNPTHRDALYEAAREALLALGPPNAEAEHREA